MACRKELAPTEKNDPGASTGATSVWEVRPNPREPAIVPDRKPRIVVNFDQRVGFFELLRWEIECHYAAVRSSLSGPRMTIFKASSGNGRCSTLASSHGN